jgi:signal peptidase
LIRIVRLAGRLALRAGLALAVLVLLAIGVGPWTGAYRTTTVLTGSMRPGMPPGSVAVISPVAPSTLRVGDVVTYQAPVADHRVVTHRVVRIVEPGEHPVIQTKGDANNAPDPWLARITSAPAWKRRAVIPYLGTVIRLMRSPRAHAATVYGAPVLLMAGWLARIWAGGAPEPQPTAA